MKDMIRKGDKRLLGTMLQTRSYIVHVPPKYNL